MTQFFKSNRFPSPVGEGLGVRSNLTKRQIEVTMFAVGVEKLEGFKVGTTSMKQLFISKESLNDIR